MSGKLVSLISFVFGLILSVLFNPAIDFLKRKYFPRILAIILVYVFIFGVLGFLIYSTAPLFVSEIQQFSQFFPEYFEKVSPLLKGLGIGAFENFEEFSGMFEQSLINASSNIFSALGAIFGGIFSAITIFSIALFISLEDKGIDRVIAALAPKRYEAFVRNISASRGI